MSTAVLAAVGTKPEPGLLVRYPETRIGPFGLFAETRTEPLAFVSTSTHRACGDPWLELTKDLGLFGQEDPAGTVDSTNRYQALGGRWTGLTDPMGLYEEDVHHYLTRFLASSVGFGDIDAERIGRATGMLDFDGRDAMFVPGGGLGANHSNMNSYHFVTPNQLGELYGKAIGSSQLNVHALGPFLHAFEDTWSHQTDPRHRDMTKMFDDTIPYTDYWIGHGAHGHNPDFTWERPELAMEMAEAVYERLRYVYRQYSKGSTSRPAPPFSEIEKTVRDFVKAEPDGTSWILYPQSFVGGLRNVWNVSDYAPKIKLLDSSYEPTFYEARERRKAYDKYLDEARKSEELRRYANRKAANQP